MRPIPIDSGSLERASGNHVIIGTIRVPLVERRGVGVDLWQFEARSRCGLLNPYGRVRVAVGVRHILVLRR